MPTFTNQATLALNGLTVNSNVVTGELVGELTITKNAVDTSYSTGSDISYVISLVNNGATDIDGLTLTDNLGAYAGATGTVTPLDYQDGSILYYVNGELQAAPTVTQNPFTMAGINVPAGGNATIAYTAVPNAFAPLAAGSIINNEVTATGTRLAAPITATRAVPVATASNLSITKIMNPTTVSAGDTLTYTFIIQNNGNEPVTVADNAVVTDALTPILNPLTVTFNGTTWTAGTNYNYETTTGQFATVAGQITVPAATYTQSATGETVSQPGVSTLILSGTVV